MNVPDIHEAGEPVPGPVRLAGLMWVGCGGVAFAISVAVALSVVTGAVEADPTNPLLCVSVACTLLVGLAGAVLFLDGFGVCAGDATRVEGPAHVSLVVGPIALLAGAGMLTLMVVLPFDRVGVADVAVAGWHATTGGFFTASGVLALRSRQPYLLRRTARRSRGSCSR